MGLANSYHDAEIRLLKCLFKDEIANEEIEIVEPSPSQQKPQNDYPSTFKTIEWEL